MESRLAALADLIWPLLCGGCQLAGTRWCGDCAAQLLGPAQLTRPDPRPAGLPPTWAATAYDGSVRRAIVSWKDDGRHDLTRPLAAGLTASLLAALGSVAAVPREGIWLVPMPSRPGARRARGGDPVRDLARIAAAQARRAGWSVRALPALRHVRAVVDQSGLGAAERAENVAGAFAVPPRWGALLGGAGCLLADDIVTTGATLAEAARAVRAAGAHPFGAVVIAATRRTRGLE